MEMIILAECLLCLYRNKGPGKRMDILQVGVLREDYQSMLMSMASKWSANLKEQTHAKFRFMHTELLEEKIGVKGENYQVRMILNGKQKLPVGKPKVKTTLEVSHFGCIQENCDYAYLPMPEEDTASSSLSTEDASSTRVLQTADFRPTTFKKCLISWTCQRWPPTLLAITQALWNTKNHTR